jgi:exoribonuclease R
MVRGLPFCAKKSCVFQPIRMKGNLGEKSTDKTFSKLNKSGQIINIVRERYLRDDIPCQSKICSRCQHSTPILENVPKKKGVEALYIVPNTIIAKKYLEILEKFNNIIICETILNHLHTKRIRKRIQDQGKGIVFANEHFSKTYKEIDSSFDEDQLIYQTAQWYHAHLMGKVKIVFICEAMPSFQAQSVQIFTLHDFLEQYNTPLLQIYQDLSISDPNKDVQYEKHLNTDFLEAQVHKKIFLKGKLKVSAYNYKEASIKNEIDNESIRISGRTNMNRAIHGDVVAVQLIGPNEGKVVGVLQRNWRDYVASIKKDQNDSEYCLCQTLDSRIPPIRIKTRQKERLMNSRIIVRIESWDADSKYPSGFYVQTLGEIGDLNTETEALLREHQIPHDDFSKDALSQIPTENPWIPSTKQRRDLRKELILSVDPIGCEDIDDALSYKELKNGNVQIGVHIADVSAFFQHDSPLDLEARKRSTTIYLIDRRLDMLPTILSTDIISLRQKCDKYAVSVIWEFTPKGDVISQWYGRTLINSS